MHKAVGIKIILTEIHESSYFTLDQEILLINRMITDPIVDFNQPY